VLQSDHTVFKAWCCSGLLIGHKDIQFADASEDD